MYSRGNIVGVRVAYKNIVERQEVATPAVSVETLLGTCTLIKQHILSLFCYITCYSALFIVYEFYLS